VVPPLHEQQEQQQQQDQSHRQWPAPWILIMRMYTDRAMPSSSLQPGCIFQCTMIYEGMHTWLTS
jgi:hypothetical protein